MFSVIGIMIASLLIVICLAYLRWAQPQGQPSAAAELARPELPVREIPEPIRAAQAGRQVKMLGVRMNRDGQLHYLAVEVDGRQAIYRDLEAAQIYSVLMGFAPPTVTFPKRSEAA